MALSNDALDTLREGVAQALIVELDVDASNLRLELVKDDELVTLCHAILPGEDEVMDVLRSYERGYGSYDDPIIVDGRAFIMGDGDDSLAVTQANNETRFWVRHFKHQF